MKSKKSHRDQLRQNDASQRYLAALAGLPVKQEWLNNVPVSRPRAKRAVGPVAQSEADIQRDIIKLLKWHPKVAMVDRINSGAMQVNGRFIKFNRVHINGQRGALSPDIHCTLKTGSRRFVVEVKEPDWEEPDWAKLAKKDGLLSEKEGREMGQKQYLDAVNKSGGIGIFARSVDDVLDALERA